ncbi:hypothetical protein NA56DRAFT_710913 [Hyaloscypha hepaticicola]|uniref:Uncharacterized protein n=1 Tax=Hyaloscypha hepaticicola TaxID=2082293 RepID=A0A2J6PKR2_9HELO|nr:hypothetical protein NA56DRAFT_710913 [Hyaloscypha hepaticicola]
MDSVHTLIWNLTVSDSCFAKSRTSALRTERDDRLPETPIGHRTHNPPEHPKNAAKILLPPVANHNFVGAYKIREEKFLSWSKQTRKKLRHYFSQSKNWEEHGQRDRGEKLAKTAEVPETAVPSKHIEFLKSLVQYREFNDELDNDYLYPELHCFFKECSQKR